MTTHTDTPRQRQKGNVRFIALAALTTSLVADLTAAGQDWMASIQGSKKISEITLPGTHDSGARVEPVFGTARTQDASIRQQLDFGIRYLDIRCRHVNNTFQIHHGAIFQNLSFQQVLDQVYSFLNANGTETVVMAVNEEHTPSNNTRSFTATFNSFVNGNPSKWALGSSVPRLSDVRGKIVLLRRFPGSSGGIDASNWPDNTGFDRNNLVVQDYYRVNDNAQKWNRVRSAFNAALAETNSNKVHINFTSGVRSGLFGVPNIRVVSNYMNPRVQDYFANAAPGNYGWVVMDFANSNRSRLIYETNAAPDTFRAGIIISLRGSNGKYASSENGSSNGMRCNRDRVGNWEKFEVVAASGGTFALKGSNGKYVSSNNGGKPITCDRSSINDWERFRVTVNGNRLSLKGNNNRYISSENGSQPMICNRSSIGSWESFVWRVE